MDDDAEDASANLKKEEDSDMSDGEGVENPEGAEEAEVRDVRYKLEWLAFSQQTVPLI